MKKMNKAKVNLFFGRNKDVILIILLHVSITIPLAFLLNIWYDEACSLNTSSSSIYYAIQRSIEFEHQPPFYYILLSIWRKLDNSYFFARLLSIIFSSASIFVSHQFIKKYLKISKPEFVTFLIAINPFLIHYATEIRLYTMIIFLSGVLIFLMYKIYFFDNKSKVYRIIFILLTIISLHAQYYMGFLLVAIGISVFIYKGWNKFKNYLVDMVFPLLSLIAVIPFLDAISKQIELSEELFKLNIAGIVEFFKVRIVSYIFALDFFPLIRFSRYEVWFFLFLITAIFLFSIKDRLKGFIRIMSFKEYTTFPTIIVLILFFILILVKIGARVLEIRHSAALFLPLIFTVTSFICLTSKKKFLIFWFLLFSVLYVAAIVNRFAPMAKEGDAIRVSRYLEAHEKENEMIFVPYNVIAFPLAVHYKGKNSIVTLYDKLLTEEDQRKLLEDIDDKSIWLDFPVPGWDRYSKEIKISRKFINDNFVLLDKKYFEGMQLWHLRRKK